MLSNLNCNGNRRIKSGRNEVVWPPGQEASLMPPRSNLRYFWSKYSLLKKVPVTLLWLFGDPVVIRRPIVTGHPGNCATLVMPLVKVVLRTACILKIIKIRSGCQYVGYLSLQLNFRLGRELDIAVLNEHGEG